MFIHGFRCILTKYLLCTMIFVSAYFSTLLIWKHCLTAKENDLSGAVYCAKRMSMLRNIRKGGELTCVLVLCDGVIRMLQPVLQW